MPKINRPPVVMLAEPNRVETGVLRAFAFAQRLGEIHLSLKRA
jgi:hypothetical protein